jgi:GNAT superfamily N-acetyltransferase
MRLTYKQKFNRKFGFPDDASHSLSEVATLTNIKLSALQEIYNKGIGAYKTNPESVRPTVKSKEQWAMARVYSAVMGGKAAKIDAKELNRGRQMSYTFGGIVGKGDRDIEGFLDSEGYWKFEISDNNAQVLDRIILRLATKSFYSSKNTDIFVKDLVVGWEGFKYYPDLMKIKVIFDPKSINDNVIAYYNKDTDEIHFNSPKILDNARKFRKKALNRGDGAGGLFESSNDGTGKVGYGGYSGVLGESVRKAVFHELQHAIQKREGVDVFASSPQRILIELKKKHKSEHLSDIDFIAYIEKKEGKSYDKIAWEFYISIPSEKETLEVEKRHFLTYDERKNNPPKLNDGGDVLLAPNGKPSNLTPEQYRLVRTPEFKAWFGDWENDPENASKVVDENGEPLVVWHGTNYDFHEFKNQSKGFTNGIFFSTKYSTANIYGKVKSFFINSKKIKIVGSYIQGAFDLSDIDGSDFDGLWNKGTNEVVVGNPNQIKLADGSNATFDGDNPDIRFDDGGKIEHYVENGLVDFNFYQTTSEHAKEYGISAKNPLYVQNLCISESERLQGVGKKVLEYLDEYAKKNNNDVIFGHIAQKATFTRDSRQSFLCDVEMIKGWLKSHGYSVNDENKDFYKMLKFSNGGKVPVRIDKHGKFIVWENDDYFIAVDDENDARYITAWYKSDSGSDKKIGVLDAWKTNLSSSFIDEEDAGSYLSIRSIDIDSKHRGRGIGKQMYRELLKWSDDNVKGIFSYLPNRVNNKQIPSIYRHFNSINKPDYQIIVKSKNEGNFERGGMIKEKDYKTWKRKNVTLRGMSKGVGEENSAGAMLGSGLYTAFLSNRKMAKEYGEVYFVVNAVPSNPKVFNTLNEWEIWFYNNLVFKYSNEQGKDFPDKRDFNKNTTIEAEMQKMGYDGIVIKGREMVHFNPKNVMYFKTEDELKKYFEINMEKFEKGGIIEGKLHSECDVIEGCGEKYNVNGQVIEAERDEAVLVPQVNYSNAVFEITGNPKQIASAVNYLGGGIMFDEGAKVKDQSGKLVQMPKKKAKFTDVFTIDSGSIIINRRSMYDKNRYVVKGTLRQIASAVNSINGNGVKIDGGAELKNLKSGEVIKMEEGGQIRHITLNEYLLRDPKYSYLESSFESIFEFLQGAPFKATKYENQPVYGSVVFYGQNKLSRGQMMALTARLNDFIDDNEDSFPYITYAQSFPDYIKVHYDFDEVYGQGGKVVCPQDMQVDFISFDKKQGWSRGSAMAWCVKHRYKITEFKETETHIQVYQSKSRPSEVDIFSTIDFGNGISANISKRTKFRFGGKLGVKNEEVNRVFNDLYSGMVGYRVDLMDMEGDTVRFYSDERNDLNNADIFRINQYFKWIKSEGVGSFDYTQKPIIHNDGSFSFFLK